VPDGEMNVLGGPGLFFSCCQKDNCNGAVSLVGNHVLVKVVVLVLLIRQIMEMIIRKDISIL